jgi:hypothetical protein
MQKVIRMLISTMPSDPPEKKKDDNESQPRDEKAPADDQDAVQPSREKVPEGHGNLRRREDWFQKRSGQTP